MLPRLCPNALPATEPRTGEINVRNALILVALFVAGALGEEAGWRS